MIENEIYGDLGEPSWEPILIDLVLLLQDSWVADVLSPSLMAAFQEVEQFYNFREKLAEFNYFYISEYEPRYLPSKFSLIESDRSKLKFMWKDAEGRFVGTYDAFKVASLVNRRFSRLSTYGEGQIIVIDKQLTPPPDWSYIIWDNVKFRQRAISVISSITMDPAYWEMGIHDDTTHRISLIKHRVRTACLSNVGQLIGLERCDNEECFLYQNVDSFLRLDRMVKLGPEHDLRALDGCGFEVLSDNPEEIQPIIIDPRQQRRYYE